MIKFAFLLLLFIIFIFTIILLKALITFFFSKLV